MSGIGDKRKGIAKECLLLALVGVVFLLSAPVLAQGVPESITYQGKLTDTDGNPLSGDQSMRFNLYDAESEGSQLWDSGALTVPLNGGVFTVTLGTTGNPVNPFILTREAVWIQTTVGTETLPRVKFTSVPYAIRAGSLTFPVYASAESSSQLLLLVNSGTGKVACFRIDDPENSSTALYADTAGGGLGGSGTDNDIARWDGALALETSALYQTDDGKFGIATTSPAEKLHIMGNVKADNYLGNSDARLKTDVQPIRGALAKVEAMRPVEFDWQRDESPDTQTEERRQLGLIAQEVKDIVPEVVFQGGDGYYSIDYSKLTPVLLAAIKEQQAMINELKAEVAELKTRQNN